ncbi:MAG: rhodanese-like domain-containing protein [Planctomycetes bacterium]|nr:rhodanese-like domain-containing protein [Planctomycetota bacterium]
MSDMTMAVLGRQQGAVSTAELAEWIEYGPAPLIIDVRDAWQFEAGSVEGAINIPVRTAARELVRSIPDDGLAVLVCGDGVMSREVARMLVYCGVRRVAWLDGGLRAWNAVRQEVLV